MNRSIDVDKKISRFVDRSILTADFFYRHNIISGVCLVVGAVFILLFLFFRLDLDGLVAFFFGNDKFKVTYKIIINTMALLGKVAGSAGLLIGVMLVCCPARMQQIERRMDTWFATQSMWERLDRSHPLPGKPWIWAPKYVCHLRTYRRWADFACCKIPRGLMFR